MSVQCLLFVFTVVLHDFLVCRHFIEEKRMRHFEFVNVALVLIMLAQAIGIAVRMMMS